MDVDRDFYAFYAVRDPAGIPPRFLFQRREKSRADSYPLHVDLVADDREAEIEHLAAAGATREATKQNAGRTWTVLRDPEGNPFCVE